MTQQEFDIKRKLVCDRIVGCAFASYNYWHDGVDDLVATDRELGNIVLELKALETVGEQQRKQLWSYLRLMNCPFGMLINFSPKGVYSERWGFDPETQKCYRIRN